MPVDFDALLAGPIMDAFGESVVVSRTSGGTYSPAARGYTGATTIGATFTADVQATNHGVSKGEDTDEVAINFRASAVAASALGDLRVDDTARVRNRTRRIVSVTYQAGGSIIRAICRSEKRAGA